jgi:hypothetical protein
MKLRSLCAKFVVAATLVLTGNLACAQDGLKGAWSRASLPSTSNLEMPLRQTLVAADFDRDNKPDGAVLIDPGLLHSSLRIIELHLTGRGNSKIRFQSNEASLSISAFDVNWDGATDIVVEQPFTHKRLQIWLNDGHGEFYSVRSQDFPSAETANNARVRFPSQQPDCPVVCTAFPRGFEIVFLTAWLLPYHFSSAPRQAQAAGLSIGSLAVAPNSPRSPPLPKSL